MNHHDRDGNEASSSARAMQIAMQIVPGLSRAHPAHRSGNDDSPNSGSALSTKHRATPKLTFHGREPRAGSQAASERRRWQALNTGLRPGLLLDVHV